MDNNVSQSENSVHCAVCLASLSILDSTCNTCGYPAAGTIAEQQTFIALRNNSLLDLTEHDKKIKTAGIYLKVIGGFTALSGFITYFTRSFQDEGMADLTINIILAVIYFSLGFWSKKKPMVAIVTGFTIYVLVFLLNLLIDPMAALSGIIFKIIIVVAFIQSIKAIKEANKIKKELYYE